MKDQCIKCKKFKECRYISMGSKLMEGVQFMYAYATDGMPSPFNVSIGCNGFEEEPNEEPTTVGKSDEQK